MDATLLQYLQHKGCVKEATAIEFLRRTMGYHLTEDTVEETRLRINRDLEFADLEIRRIASPMDGEIYVSLVNKQDDFVTEMLAAKHPSTQPEYFNRLMTVMLQSAEDAEVGGCISEADAMKIGRGAASEFLTDLALPPHQCTAIVESLLQDGWIQHHPHKGGHYSLGVRTFMEFHDEILRMDLPEATRAHLEKYL